MMFASVLPEQLTTAVIEWQQVFTDAREKVGDLMGVILRAAGRWPVGPSGRPLGDGGEHRLFALARQIAPELQQHALETILDDVAGRWCVAVSGRIQQKRAFRHR